MKDAMRNFFVLGLITFSSYNFVKSEYASNKHFTKNNLLGYPQYWRSLSPVADEDIVGTWKLSLDCFDHNGNRTLDDDELKKGIPNNYILQLNADRTCKLQQAFTGRYEIKTENSRRILKVYRKKVEGEEDKDPLPDVYEIKSVKKDELILLVFDGMSPTTFWIFKRVK